MHKLQVSYAMYIKLKTGLERGTPVFEWRFKAKRIDTEEYLYQCIAYVNYNPVKHEIVKNIEDYPYTSYHQFIDKQKFTGVPVPELDELEF
jgi:putative transposase